MTRCICRYCGLGRIIDDGRDAQLAIVKETGRRLGFGHHMYPAKVLKDGPAPGSKHANLDEMIMDADGFAGWVFFFAQDA